MILIETQKYYYVLDSKFIFHFFNGHTHKMLFRRGSTLCKWTLKIATLFRRCLTLFKSTLKQATLVRRCSTLQIPTLTYITLFQAKNNVKTTLKYFLGALSPRALSYFSTASISSWPGILIYKDLTSINTTIVSLVYVFNLFYKTWSAFNV